MNILTKTSLYIATATVQVIKPQLLGADPVSGSGSSAILVDGFIEDVDEDGDHDDDDDCMDEMEDGDDFWHTSVGKFKFTLDALPQPLQYIHQLLTELATIEKPDILYYMLQCLNTLALHGDALTRAARDQRGFFIWCQENLLIKK